MISLLLQSFGYGLLHGILPDEHTWPITFSYAIGNASSKKGLKSGLYLFTRLHRSAVDRIGNLLPASFLLVHEGLDQLLCQHGCRGGHALGGQIQKKGRYLHFHLLGHHHEPSEGVERSPALFGPQHKSETLAASPSGDPEPFPARWAMIHGFVAGFGVGPFAMFVYTVAAPQMGSPWLGFLPGFLFGLGTTAMLMILGGLFGASLKTTRKFDDHEIAAIGLRTGSLTLLGGGVVFVVGGLLQEGLHLYEREIDLEKWMIGIIMAGVAIPVLVYSIWKVLRCRKDSPPRSLQGVV